MRTHLWTLLALTLIGCGSTDPFFWDKCDEAPCNTAASSVWDVFADGGDITSGSYDFLGPPDPYVCLTVAGKTECSASASDRSHPRWSDLLFSEVRASAIVGGALGVRLLDKDTDIGLDETDSICSGEVLVTEHDLAEGGVKFECDRASATFTFHFVR